MHPDDHNELNAPLKFAWYKTLLCLVGLPVRTASPKIHRTPWLTWLLVVFIVITSFYFWFDLGKSPEGVVNSIWQVVIFTPNAQGLTWLYGLIAYAFLHGDLWHLSGNLYFLVLFGRHVECRFGSRRFLGLFLLSSIAGGLLHGMFSEMRLIGASSGVFGVLVFHALLLPKSRVLWLPFGPILRIVLFTTAFRILRKGFPMAAYVAVYLAFQLVLLSEQLFHEGRISALGHLGGAFAGLLIYKGWRRGWLN